MESAGQKQPVPLFRPLSAQPTELAGLWLLRRPGCAAGVSSRHLASPAESGVFALRGSDLLLPLCPRRTLQWRVERTKKILITELSRGKIRISIPRPPRIRCRLQAPSASDPPQGGSEMRPALRSPPSQVVRPLTLLPGWFRIKLKSK